MSIDGGERSADPARYRSMDLVSTKSYLLLVIRVADAMSSMGSCEATLSGSVTVVHMIMVPSWLKNSFQFSKRYNT